MYCRISVAAALCLLVSLVPAQAEQSIEVNIPFGFEAGKVQMPAGLYAVSFPSTQTVFIRSADSKHHTFLITNRVIANGYQSAGKLVFKRYGERHFLNQIWSGVSSEGRQLRPSKAEVELARGLSQPAGREVAAALPPRR